MDEAAERELEALMRQRKVVEARLNRALNELLGSGAGSAEAIAAIEQMEEALRAIAAFARQIGA